MKKTILLVVSFLWLLSLKAQQKTIAERLGYPKNTRLLILHADDVGVISWREIRDKLYR